MQLFTTSGKPTKGCCTFDVGRFTVSVSNVFETGGGQTAVFSKETPAPLKEFHGHSAETVVEAIRWAERAEKRARARQLSAMAATPEVVS